MTPQARHLSVSLLLAVLATTFLPAQSREGVDILLGKARSLEARGRMDLAAQNWNQVLLVDANQTDALAGLARHAKQSGDAGALRRYLDRLRKVNPRHPAIGAVERMHVLSPQERSRLDEAVRLTADRRPDDAMKIYREVFGNAPPSGKWAESFYETLATSTGGRDAAIAQLRGLTSGDSGNEVYRLWLARILSYEPKTRTEALRLLESIHDSGAVEQARSVWRQALVWEKDNPSAQASLEAYVQRYPDRELQESVTRLREHRARAIQDADKQVGFQALRSKDTTTAQVKFEEVLRRSPSDTNALVGLGFVRLDQKRFDEALTLFDKARGLAPKRSDIREGYDTAAYWSAMQRGSALEQRDAEASIAAYQSALAIRPHEEQPVLAVAQVMLRRQNLPEAGARFEQILQRSPGNADALAGLGFVRLNEKNFDEAAQLLGKARALTPDRTEVEQGYRTATFWGLMTRASAALEANRAEEAITGFEKALAINPGAKDALLGLAGAAEQVRNPARALQAYDRLTEVDPADARGWRGAIRAHIASDDPAAAVRTAGRIPTSVRQQLETRADYLSELALALIANGQSADADQFLTRALDIAAEGDTDEALAARMQAANVLADQGNVDRAITIYARAVASRPANVLAWQGLIGAYAALRDFPRAMTAIRSIPPDSFAAASKNAGFLNAVASVYAADGRCVAAEDLLVKSLALDRSSGRQPSPNTQLQLADIWMREGRSDKARQGYRDLVTANPRSLDGWRGYITALHNERDSRTLLAEALRMPADVRTTLENDTGILTLLASAHVAAGEHDQAVHRLQQARARYRAQRQVPPPDLEVQLGWAMLSASRQDGLTDLIGEARARTDFTPAQREAIDEILSAWTLRRVEATLEAGRKEEAVAMLTAAQRDMPLNPRIPAALAALHLRDENYGQALAVYQAWGMAGADAGDYRAAAGAAIASHDAALADRFLQEGLKHWPNDREMLRMTAKQVASRGDYREAERLLKTAIKVEPGQTKQPGRTGQGAPPAVTSAPRVASAEAACRQDTATSAPNPNRPRVMLASLRRVVPLPVAQAQTSSSQPQTGSAEPQTGPAEPQSGSGEPQTRQAGPPDTQPVEQIQDEIDSLRNRNTPFAVGGANFVGRAGDPGISRLIVRDVSPGGSVTIRNSVRFGIDVHAVSLRTGRADGESDNRFGTLGPRTTFLEQTASGTGGELQVSGNAFGLAFGTSPRGFLTDTWTGGVRLGASDGPLRLIAIRERVKDSMLSYAGVRDPGTGTVWGGVVSSSVSVQVAHDAEGVGQYLSLGAGVLRGENVVNNYNMEGSAGAYWTIATSDRSALSLGLNVAAMHYRKNLSFFSLGHGGYFSPQRFIQGSVPLRWSLRSNRVTSEIMASPGVQYFEEDASPFYPTGAVVSPTPLAYQANDRKGPNYNVAVRVYYRVAPHVHIGAFGAANNTRDFDSRTLGISLKVLANRLPTSDIPVKSIPDWRGNQPFGD